MSSEEALSTANEGWSGWASGNQTWRTGRQKLDDRSLASPVQTQGTAADTIGPSGDETFALVAHLKDTCILPKQSAVTPWQQAMDEA